MKKILIAIDGPAGAGKSTVAKAIADKYNILYLNTGNLYRALAYACIENNIDRNIEGDVVDCVKKQTVEVEFANGEQVTLLNGQIMGQELRSENASITSSKISSYQSVREVVNGIARAVSSKMSIVMDGRDTTSVILPFADYKFYLDASPEIRADRRKKELEARGEDVNYKDLLESIIKRDYDDSHRKLAPLTRVEDAIYIDSSNMNLEEVVNYCKSKIKI